jgi:antitoxin component YwqK of YwqJK toxin-antitoxin module
MKGYLFIAIILLISCSKEAIITEDAIRSDLFYRSNDVNPFTGTCKVVFDNTNLLKEKFHFKNGKLDGDAEAFYRDGKLRWKGKYKNGCSVGKWEYWDQNGKKTIEAYYLNDTLNGPYYSWYNNGLIREKGQFIQNSRTGKWINFNETGQVISETIY